MKKQTKETKGITLIALVITIVVLIILAAIMINITLGENGLFTRAKLGASQYNEAQAKEQVQVMLTDYMVRKETDEPNLQLSTFLDEQKTNGKIQGYTDNEDGTVTIEVAGREVDVDKDTISVVSEKNDVDYSSTLDEFFDGKYSWDLESNMTIEEGYNASIVAYVSNAVYVTYRGGIYMVPWGNEENEILNSSKAVTNIKLSKFRRVSN